jgi:hypothetical protein
VAAIFLRFLYTMLFLWKVSNMRPSMQGTKMHRRDRMVTGRL